MPTTAEALRPALDGVAEEIIAAIRAEVPEYSRPLTGGFGRDVRRGVEVALRRFIDRLERPERRATDREREVYVALGRGEARAGRSLDSLLAAYRVGARISWRRVVDAGKAGGLAPDILYDIGEAIFAYIDAISAESVEGYTGEQARTAGERERRRRGLGRLLSADPPAAPERVRAEAARADWRLPERLVAIVVAADSARHLPADALTLSGEDQIVAFVGDPDGPGRRGELARAAPAAIGPAVPWTEAHRSLARARAVRALQHAGILPADELVDADDHLDLLLVHEAPELGAELAARLLAPLDGEKPAARERLVATLRAWVDDPGQPQRMAASLGVHPQTVRYRLKRLRDLLPPGALDDPEERFRLALALRAGGA